MVKQSQNETVTFFTNDYHDTILTTPVSSLNSFPDFKHHLLQMSHCFDVKLLYSRGLAYSAEIGSLSR